MRAIAAAVLALGAVAALLVFSGGDSASRSAARREADDPGPVALRKDPEPARARPDRTPTTVARPPVVHRSEPDGATRDDGFDWLRELKEPAFDLTEDAAGFEALFERTVEGPELDGATWTPTEPLVDGTTLRFAAGTHEWQVRPLRHAEQFPRDLLVEGAVMDKTLLRIRMLSTDRAVVNLTFRNLTIDCQNRPLLAMRNEPVTIRLDRCRVLGFDSGAGGSTMMVARSAVLLAVDSEVLAGYGRSPGSGNLFRIRRMLLARFLRCTIRGPFQGVLAGRGRAAHIFVECSFEQLDERLKLRIDDPDVAIYHACRFAWEKRASREKQSLSDLNPDWPDRE